MKAKNIFFIIILIVIITWPSDKSIFKPKVNADDFIFEPDSLAVASLINMVNIEDAKPDDKVVANCNCVKGKVSYDGGTSWTDCPCIINGTKCNCKDCPCNKKSGSAIPTSVAEVDNSYIFNDYYVLKVTAGWCAPCKKWSAVIKPSFKTKGIFVEEVDYDNSKNLVETVGIGSIPHFLICTKIDKTYHAVDNMGNFYGSNSTIFSVDDYKNEVLKLDKVLHPNRANGLIYNRVQTNQTPLNGKLWATKREYITHLLNHANHKNDIQGWPLDKLSVYELKAIHDDDHANQLGPLISLTK